MEEEDWVALPCFEVVEAEALDLDVVVRGLGHGATMPAPGAAVTGL
jgi:hypothetical protein